MPRPGKNISAAATILAGSFSARFPPRTCNAAIQNFKNAIDLDPHFALAYSGLGGCYANRFFKGLGEAEDYTHAETAFSKAFFYDPNVVEARVLMTMIYMARGEKKKARAEIELLQKQFPNEAPLYFMKGVINRLDGNYEESLKAFEKLSRLDPAARAVCGIQSGTHLHLQTGLREGDQGDRTGRKSRARSSDAEDLSLGRLLLPRRQADGDRPDEQGARRASEHGRHPAAVCDLSRRFGP